MKSGCIEPFVEVAHEITGFKAKEIVELKEKNESDEKKGRKLEPGDVVKVTLPLLAHCVPRHKFSGSMEKWSNLSQMHCHF